MKPNFALSLSFEGISLLHRAFPGWNRVGEVALDSPDLAGALAVLRETAEQIAGHDITCKLVIPNDQIKFLSLDLGIMGEDERRSAIRTALEGATPYPVDDLEFDWSLEGDTTLVAAVARETLAEAEQFAEMHGFGPVSFVAIPPEGLFSGEPFFGETSNAQSHLADGGNVQRDMAAIRVTGVARLPDPGDSEEPEPADNALLLTQPLDDEPIDEPVESPDPEETAAETHAVSDSGADAEDETEKEDEPEAETETEAETVAEVALEPDVDAEPTAEDEAETEPDIDTETEPVADPGPEYLPVFGHQEQEEVKPDEEEPDIEEPGAFVASVLSDTLPAEADTVQEDIAEPESDPDQDAATDEEPAPAFASMRAHRGEEGLASAPSLNGVSRGHDDLSDHSTPFPSTGPELEHDAPVAAPGTDHPDEPEVAVGIPPAPPLYPFSEDSATEIEPAPQFDNWHDDTFEPEITPDLPEAPRETRLSFFGRKSGEIASGLATSIATRSNRRSERRADARAEKNAANASDQAEADRESERQRMTVFGARKPEKRKQEIGGKPRYLGLVLSVVLLLFLAVVAAWATVFVDDGLSRFFSGPPETDVAVLPADAVDELAVEGEEAMVPALPDDLAEPVELAALSPEPQSEELAPPELVQPALPHALTEKEAQARYAVTGVWQRAPQAPQLPDQLSLDDFYVTSIDPRVDAQDAVALPAPTALATDIALDRVPSPAARGTRFQLDERGLVVARAEGALSPEGFLVFAGRPKVYPTALPQRPGSDGPGVSDAEQERLAGIRPKSRPGGLIEQNERENLGGLTRAELATKRPRLRPEQPAQKIEEEKEETGTRFAVAESRKPKPRPSNFASLVERARKTAPATEPEETTRVAAAVPQSQVTAPPIPSKNSVATAATVRNQINLRKINLIGIYGKPSSRRALVRLANGRYKKVKVGDRLDGGQVQAIGDSELRYSKRGRDVILKMPRG